MVAYALVVGFGSGLGVSLIVSSVWRWYSERKFKKIVDASRKEYLN